MTISTTQAIEAIMSYCGSHDLNLFTSDPTVLQYDGMYPFLTVDVEDGLPVENRLSNERRANTGRPIDWYSITGKYLGQKFTQSEGTLIEVLFDLNIFDPAYTLELDEMYINGIEGYRSDGIRLPHNRKRKTR